MAFTVPIGDARIVGLVDRMHPIDPPWHYPHVPEAAWEPYRDVLTDETFGLLNFRGFLIQADARTILVDTGWGPDFTPPGAPATPARLLEELAEVGVTVDDVDLVVFSHLHADHVGWNLVREDGVVRPRFRNARYLVPAADWTHYSTREEMHPNIRQNALPLGDLGVMDQFDGEFDVSASLRSVPTPGHTPGHMSFVLSSGGEHCFLLGDVAHHPIIAHETDWVHRFDWDPPQAIATRQTVLDRLERDGSLVAAGHFPKPGFGHFGRVDGRRVWRPLEVTGSA